MGIFWLGQDERFGAGAVADVCAPALPCSVQVMVQGCPWSMEANWV